MKEIEEADKISEQFDKDCIVAYQFTYHAGINPELLPVLFELIDKASSPKNFGQNFWNWVSNRSRQLVFIKQAADKCRENFI